MRTTSCTTSAWRVPSARACGCGCYRQTLTWIYPGASPRSYVNTNFRRGRLLDIWEFSLMVDEKLVKVQQGPRVASERKHARLLPHGVELHANDGQRRRQQQHHTYTARYEGAYCKQCQGRPHGRDAFRFAELLSLRGSIAHHLPCPHDCQCHGSNSRTVEGAARTSTHMMSSLKYVAACWNVCTRKTPSNESSR